MGRLLLLAAIAVATRLPAQTIEEYRWWVNDDPATLVTVTVAPAMEVMVNTDLALPPLDKEFNTITMQLKDGTGEWSVPYTMLFSRGTGLVNGYEYWIDDDVASSMSGSIGPNSLVDLIADLPTGVPTGTHTFTIRFSSENGTWSVPLVSAFESFVSIAELPGVTDLLLFPNPVTDALGLRLHADAARTLQLEVLDIRGSRVLDLSTWSVSGTTRRTWDIGGLASGSYVLRLSDGTGAANLPFVKP